MFFIISQVRDEEILSALMSINMKDKDCDLFKMYIFLALAEHWLLSSSILDENPIMKEMWALYLRNCSCQIASTDLRPHALKVCWTSVFFLVSAPFSDVL